MCGHQPLPCPNNCGAIHQRQSLESHVAKDCALTVVECDFYYAGCEVKLPRKDMPDHLKDGLITHFSLLAVSHKQQQDEIKALKKHQEDLKSLEKRQQEETKASDEEVDELKMQTKQLRLHARIVPVDFVVENPHQYHIIWSSTPFYSHSQGYKLRIDINQELFFEYFFVRAYLMQGEFDDNLKWPLDAVVIIYVLSQQSKDLERKIELQKKVVCKKAILTLTVKLTLIYLHTYTIIAFTLEFLPCN